MRSSGILMHISSLPSPGGIGSMGDEAYAFADFLQASGIRIWQVLPIGPTGYGESPYQSSSVFAGNPLLISCVRLREEGFLEYTDDEEFEPEDPEKVNYDAVRSNKETLLRRCYDQSRDSLSGQISEFIRDNAWVNDFALFTALKQRFGGVMWTKWPDPDIRFRKPEAVKRYQEELAREIDYHIFCQYLFRRQWFSLKKYCNERSLMLFGDMPIYVAEDSADTWTHPDIFQLDKNLIPKRVAGVPPDYFCEDGQLWGNPLYRWTYLRFFRKFDWWVDRMKGMALLYDMIRIDHFIGFANYYSVPYGAPNARGGKWIVGPGRHLFDTLNRKLPGLNIVAEDLGEVNDRVRKLLAYTGYPGMKVLTFAFGGDENNMHLPQNIPENTAYYTGTHDNNTALGWAMTASDEEISYAGKKIGFKKREEAPWALIQALLESKARIAVVPMQDLLELPAWATMNHPGILGGNWMWRMKPGAATPEIAAKLKELNEKYNRRNATA